jgi:hypothetical protein
LVIHESTAATTRRAEAGPLRSPWCRAAA